MALSGSAVGVAAVIGRGWIYYGKNYRSCRCLPVPVDRRTAIDYSGLHLAYVLPAVPAWASQRHGSTRVGMGTSFCLLAESMVMIVMQ